jgi:uncharacterized membrane protein
VSRLLSLDALRGVAVILMMTQHLGVWLWQVEEPHRGVIAQAPVYMGINGLGGLAAPIFITLAGAGSSLLVARAGRERALDLTLVRRGIVLMGFGYLLNWLTPSWFSMGTWFVLHMMGLAIATTPIWRRLGERALLAAEPVILLLTVAAQSWLLTPAMLDNSRMRNVHLPGGPLRLALAEGQFPVLPWLALFLVGMVIGRWLVAEPETAAARVSGLCRVCLLAGLAIVGLDLAAGTIPALGFLHGDPWWRLVRVRTGFFPAGPGIVLLLQAGVLLLLAVALRRERSRELDPRGWLVCLGRGSLTLLLVHVVLFREISRPLGAWQAFDRYTSLAIIAAWIAVCALLCRIWARGGYRFGAEWLLRRLGG